MTMDEKLIKELAHRYFSGKMPKNLKMYLFDRYGEEPLEGDLSPQFFFPAILSDISKYIQGSLDTTLRTELQKLQDRYEELSNITCGMAQERRRLETENQYLSDFIRWMHLEGRYLNFRKKAYPEKDEYGFEYYTS